MALAISLWEIATNLDLVVVMTYEFIMMDLHSYIDETEMEIFIHYEMVQKTVFSPTDGEVILYHNATRNLKPLLLVLKTCNLKLADTIRRW